MTLLYEVLKVAEGDTSSLLIDFEVEGPLIGAHGCGCRRSCKFQNLLFGFRP